MNCDFTCNCTNTCSPLPFHPSPLPPPFILSTSLPTSIPSLLSHHSTILYGCKQKFKWVRLTRGWGLFNSHEYVWWLVWFLNYTSKQFGEKDFCLKIVCWTLIDWFFFLFCMKIVVKSRFGSHRIGNIDPFFFNWLLLKKICCTYVNIWNYLLSRSCVWFLDVRSHMSLSYVGPSRSWWRIQRKSYWNPD